MVGDNLLADIQGASRPGWTRLGTIRVAARRPCHRPHLGGGRIRGAPSADSQRRKNNI
ncbi:HAD hydrolase-like protein [Flavonifractor plautii]|nr:HAD hydrolase-like protein [Flavonifractor plautii]